MHHVNRLGDAFRKQLKMMNPVLMAKIGLRIVQRFAMRFTVGFAPLRNMVSKWMVRIKKSAPLPALSSHVFEYFPKSLLNAQLHEKGISQALKVKEEQVEAILDFCKNSNATIGLKDQARVHREKIYLSVTASKPPIKSVSYYYYYDVHNKCEAVRDIVFNKELLSVVRDYLGAEPTLLFSTIIWTFPVLQKGSRVRDEGQFGFHFDIPDFKSLAVFVYLNDVDEDSGPHVVIEGTHKRKPLKSLFINTLSNSSALKKYADQIRVLTGAKGTTVIEDIYSYHKATNPRKPRLALKFFYGVRRGTMIHNRNLKDFARRSSEKGLKAVPIPT